MESSETHSEKFDAEQSLHTIQEMLLVSQRRLKHDGILMIVWGWIMTLNYVADYILRVTDFHWRITWNIKWAFVGIIVLGFVFTIYYIFQRRKKVQTYIGISLRYVWIGMFLSLVLVNLIQFNVLKEINFELQHPIFMVIIAFATVVTGGILRYKLIVYGGICFALLAYASSYLPLAPQLLLESLAWFLAFVIPGHILYRGRNK